MVFAGPILNQAGEVAVAEGEILTPDLMSSVDWFVQGVTGSPKEKNQLEYFSKIWNGGSGLHASPQWEGYLWI